MIGLKCKCKSKRGSPLKKQAKFSFDILGINAENLKVNKCSHTNKSEQMSI